MADDHRADMVEEQEMQEAAASKGKGDTTSSSHARHS
jgi:hypothetical protein